MNISSRLAVHSAVYVLLGTISLLFLVNYQLKSYAVTIAEEKAALLLAEKQATISYVVHDLRPPLFELIEKHKTPSSYFEPSWMSASYINRKIMEYLNESGFSEYYYKNAAIDARSPKNEADGIEVGYLLQAQQNPSINHKSSVEVINGKPFLVNMRPNSSIFKDVCMKCHSQPENAPEGLLEKYGEERSFNKVLGDTPSVLSIRIPLDSVYAKIDSLTFHILFSICCLVTLVFILHWFVINRLIVTPIKNITQKAVAITRDESLLGETITNEGKGELKELSGAFSDMSVKLAERNQELNHLIETRTEELKSAKEELQMVFDKMLEGFAIHEMIFDDNNRPKDYIFLKVNPAFELMMGQDAENIVGKSVLEVMLNTEMFWLETYGEVVQSGKPVKFENFSKELNKHFEINAFKNDHNQFTCIFEDITENKIAELERKELEEKLRQAYKMEALGTLSGGIAHDFNNLLAAILGYAEMAQDDVPDDHPAKNSIEQVLTAGNRAKEIVKQILSFSRMEITKKVPLQLDILVNEALNLLRATIPTTIEIRPNITPACGTVLADPNQIHQVLMNLCTNSAHALDETGGVIEVSLDTYMPERNTIVSGVEDKKYIRLTIEDNGTGIDNKIQGKIFDPYFTTKEVGEGSGMGLSVVTGIVKSHDGRLIVDSKLGEGTTFTIYFPMVDESIQHNRRINDPIPTGSERIIIVDDDTIVIGMTKRMVEHLGYQVTTQTSSAAALDLFRSQPDAYDLVISDQTMPELTGVKLAKKLKEIRPNIPIIICSGYSSKMDAEQAEHIGISAFVMKPFERKELSRVIRKVLDEKNNKLG